MIKMPVFPKEEEYLERVKTLAQNNNQDYEDMEKALEEIEELRDILYKNEEKDKKPLFDKLILARFDVLNEIYNLVEEKYQNIFKVNDKEEEKEVLKKEWEKFNKIYNKFVNERNNTWLIDNYGIKCCPYCNENFVFNRRKKSGKVYAMAQLDHFYPKSKFPIFALCLYNIVPACTSCNHIKSTHDLKISPHDHSRNFSDLRITYKPRSADFINDTNNFDISFEYDNFNSKFATDMEVNLEVLGIKETYKEHKDYVQEIIKKAVIYSKEYRNSLLSEFDTLFSSDEELVRTIFGNYIEQKDLLKRPLSKITQDILKESNLLVQEQTILEKK